MQKLPSFLRSLVDVAVWGCLALLFAQVIAGFVSIPSGSMQPTLQPGDYLLVNRVAYGVHVPFTASKEVVRWSTPSRGDIIIFNAPVEVSPSEALYIKRVVAVPGDKVAVNNDRVILNGLELPYAEGAECKPQEFREHQAERTHCVLTGPSPLSQMATRTVPAGHVFVLGDHRNNSRDSRDWGMLPLERVRGQALFRVLGGPGSEGVGPVR